MFEVYIKSRVENKAIDDYSQTGNNIAHLLNHQARWDHFTYKCYIVFPELCHPDKIGICIIKKTL